MATSKAIERLKRKLSTGRSLPVEFDVVASSDLPLTIAWSSLKPHGLNKSAELEMVPFIRVADGSLVAIWFAIAPPAIVVLGAHGEPPRIVAKDFPNFLRAITDSQTGVPDIDEDCADISIPLYTARPSRAGITALQKKLDSWSQENSSLEQPRKSRGSEALRKCLYKVVKQMIHDGLSKIHTARDYHWDMNSEIKRTRSGLQVEYLDCGKWYDVPTRYELRSIAGELLALVKNPKLRKYELVVTKDGIVSVDEDRQLVLVPPA